MTTMQRSLIVIAGLVLVAVTIAVGSGAATGTAARALGVIQGLLLVAASLTLMRRRQDETRAAQQPATPPFAKDAPLTGLASTILEGETPSAPRK